MKITNILLLVLIITSCTSGDYDEITKSVIPKEIKPYYDSFIYEASIRGLDFSNDYLHIVVADTVFCNNHSVGGGCSTKSEITISSAWVKMAQAHENNERNLEHLLFHELAHHVMNRRHLDEVDSNGLPTSIMHSHKMGYSGKNFHRREKLIDELFSI